MMLQSTSDDSTLNSTPSATRHTPASDSSGERGGSGGGAAELWRARDTKRLPSLMRSVPDRSRLALRREDASQILAPPRRSGTLPVVRWHRSGARSPGSAAICMAGRAAPGHPLIARLCARRGAQTDAQLPPGARAAGVRHSARPVRQGEARRSRWAGGRHHRCKPARCAGCRARRRRPSGASSGDRPRAATSDGDAAPGAGCRAGCGRSTGASSGGRAGVARGHPFRPGAVRHAAAHRLLAFPWYQASFWAWRRWNWGALRSTSLGGCAGCGIA